MRAASGEVVAGRRPAGCGSNRSNAACSASSRKAWNRDSPICNVSHASGTDFNGQAEVRSIGPCPPIAGGTGRIVTGTFRHSAANIIDLHVDGLSEPIGTTANHPFWSIDRQSFVRADSLQPGERLRGADGPHAVVGVIPRAAPEAVYNLEIQVDHVYHVSSGGLLVHNGTEDCLGNARSLVDEMSPSEAERYRKYWGERYHGHDQGTRFRDQAAPGTRSITDQKLSSETGELYPRETIFDEYGRRIGNNDFTNHGGADHPNPHHHTRNPLTGERGSGSGLHPNTPTPSK
jgi:hypothetical protein